MDYIIEINKVKILVKNVKYDMLNNRIKPYVIESNSFDFVIDIKDEDVLKASKSLNCSEELAEYMYSGHVFSRTMLDYNSIMIHSSSVAVNSLAYSFSGDSGQGKSTHASLYLKEFNGMNYSIFDELEDITVAGYKLVSEKAITSPKICPLVKDETCIILVPNVLFISILPSRINPTEVQISPSKAIISFFE